MVPILVNNLMIFSNDKVVYIHYILKGTNEINSYQFNNWVQKVKKMRKIYGLGTYYLPAYEIKWPLVTSQIFW